MFGHPEYDVETLLLEYERDLGRGLPVSVPAHYFPDDDPAQAPHATWRAHAQLLYTNWLNYYVYQTTPYDLAKIGAEGPAREGEASQAQGCLLYTSRKRPRQAGALRTRANQSCAPALGAGAHGRKRVLRRHDGQQHAANEEQYQYLHQHVNDGAQPARLRELGGGVVPFAVRNHHRRAERQQEAASRDRPHEHGEDGRRHARRCV